MNLPNRFPIDSDLFIIGNGKTCFLGFLKHGRQRLAAEVPLVQRHLCFTDNGSDNARLGFDATNGTHTSMFFRNLADRKVESRNTTECIPTISHRC